MFLQRSVADLLYGFVFASLAVVHEVLYEWWTGKFILSLKYLLVDFVSLTLLVVDY